MDQESYKGYHKDKYQRYYQDWRVISGENPRCETRSLDVVR